MGVGQGAEYRSFLTLRDFPSKGNSHVIRHTTIPRLFIFFSDPEATNFYLRERNPRIVDMRENVPILDIDWTMEACAHVGIRHQYKNGYPFPFTLDLVISELYGKDVEDRVESVKTPEDAAKEEVLKRLSVEANWCRIRPEVSYSLIDTAAYMENDKQLLSVLLFMRRWFQEGYQSNGIREAKFERAFSTAYERNMPLDELMRKAAKTMRISEDLALDMFRFCAWHDRIPVSLKRPLALNLPVIMR
jgi:hypothetical protein